MTALWHEQQKAIQAGEHDANAFIRELMEYIAGEVNAVKENGIGITVETPRCPECQKPLRRIKGSKGFFWGCTGFAEGGCTFSCPDKRGKPAPKESLKVSALHTCQSCGKGLFADLARRKGHSGGAVVVFLPVNRPIQMSGESLTIANVLESQHVSSTSSFTGWWSYGVRREARTRGHKCEAPSCKVGGQTRPTTPASYLREPVLRSNLGPYPLSAHFFSALTAVLASLFSRERAVERKAVGKKHENR